MKEHIKESFFDAIAFAFIAILAGFCFTLGAAIVVHFFDL